MRALVCLLLLGTLGALDVEAQRRPPRSWDRGKQVRWNDRGPAEFGIRGGNDFEEGVGFAGAQLRLPAVRWLRLVPSADVFFEDARTEWQLNADVAVQPYELGGLYLGAGAAFANRDFDLDGEAGVEAGYNLIVGLDGGQMFHSRVKPFAEARWTDVRDYTPFRLALGINVPVR